MGKVVFTLLLVPMLTAANAPRETEIDYRELLISYLTARQCGLDDFSVTGGFRSTVFELHASRNISPSEGREIRQHANAAFRREWGDGNGTARCASEGQAAATWLRKLLDRD